LKYISISEFRHSIIIQAKKYLINPGDVIESPTALSYIFLQQVDDKTPITSKEPFSGGRFQQQVSSLQKEKEAISADASSNIEQLKRLFEKFIDEYEKDKEDITNQINNQIAGFETDIKFREDTNRRLSILKDAVRTIEDEVFGVADVPPKN
jgi:hypothetical protein